MCRAIARTVGRLEQITLISLIGLSNANTAKKIRCRPWDPPAWKAKAAASANLHNRINLKYKLSNHFKCLSWWEHALDSIYRAFIVGLLIDGMGSQLWTMVNKTISIALYSTPSFSQFSSHWIPSMQLGSKTCNFRHWAQFQFNHFNYWC